MAPRDEAPSELRTRSYPRSAVRPQGTATIHAVSLGNVHMLLAGDIGGTKTALAVYSRAAGPMSPLAQAEFPSADFASLEDIGSAFVARMKIPVDEACFAIAGPVING